ncbi:MAG: hypothetical protein ACR2MZ_10085 [Candidatus Dormibacter sp.]|uniref:PaaD-like zinc ribbon domain-containing protein n=1 Tax=Candidatus Dormibacter sp. TaxID=2973982 RepID=UPI003D9B0E6D
MPGAGDPDQVRSTTALSACCGAWRRTGTPPRESEPSAESGSPRSTPRCPHCGSERAAVISLFGTQAMTLQYRCEACGTLFEAVKYDTEEP